MLIFSGKIPVRIHFVFVIFAFLIGWLSTFNLMLTLTWVGIIFLSVLIHEFGHALTAMLFGQRAQIDLVALGGVTRRMGPKLAWWKEFIIVLNGPLAGLFLGIGSYFLLQSIRQTGHHPLLGYVLEVTTIINVFWTIVNLLPVLPLDGGQLMKILMELAFGLKGLKAAQFISFILAACIGILFFLNNSLLAGIIFFLIATEGYQAWRSMIPVTEKDQDDTLQLKFHVAEKCLKTGDQEKGMQILNEIRQESKSGVLYIAATELLAKGFSDQGEYRQAYDILISARQKLSVEGLKLLHRLAYQNGDINETINIGNKLFRTEPDSQIAILNAICHALRNEEKPAVGWLQSALREGATNVKDVVRQAEFDHIRQGDYFREFEQRMQS